MALQTGQVLNNRYRIVKLLGQGGYGAVYRAWDINFQMPCAVKENTETSQESQRQFLREAKILHALRHNSLPLVKDHFILPDQGQYLVMDYIEGDDLAAIMRREGKALAEEQVLSLLGDICQALEFLHSRTPPIIHRDIKPANIKITPQGKAVLVDFGISKVYDPELPTTQGARGVTPGYSPFEQYGNAPTDARTDIYALGATAYNLLTGLVPIESITRMAGQPLTPIRQINPDISTASEQAIFKAMELMPEARFASASDFHQALQKQVDPIQTIPPTIMAGTAQPEARQHKPISAAPAARAALLKPVAPTAAAQAPQKPPQAVQHPKAAPGNKTIQPARHKEKRARRPWLVLALLIVGAISVAVFSRLADNIQESSIAGFCKGTMHEYHGDQLEYDFEMEIQHRSGEEGFEGMIILFPPNHEPEEFHINGAFDGNSLHFNDNRDFFYFGALEGEMIIGEFAIGCYECEPIGHYECLR